MPAISISADLRPLHRALLDIGHKQVPFATALGLTRIAQAVQADEVKEIDRTFDQPMPFTENAFAIVPAKKDKPVAVVFAKDAQATYLAPYVVGGDRSLGGKKGMLVPIGAATNQYGNLSRGQLAKLKGKPNVFIGPVTLKDGRTINGVWQRIPAVEAVEEVSHLEDIVLPDGTAGTRLVIDRAGVAASPGMPAIEAGDIYTVRYEALLVWIAAAHEAGLTALEARVTALETAHAQ